MNKLEIWNVEMRRMELIGIKTIKTLAARRMTTTRMRVTRTTNLQMKIRMRKQMDYNYMTTIHFGFFSYSVNRVASQNLSTGYILANKRDSIFVNGFIDRQVDLLANYHPWLEGRNSSTVHDDPTHGFSSYPRPRFSNFPNSTTYFMTWYFEHFISPQVLQPFKRSSLVLSVRERKETLFQTLFWTIMYPCTMLLSLLHIQPHSHFLKSLICPEPCSPEKSPSP